MSKTLKTVLEETILILENEPALLEGTKFLLKKLPFKVASASDGAEAFQYLKNNPHTVSLIISDINMPGMDGLAFLSKIKADHAFKAIPVILLSAAPDDEIKKGWNLGADGYVHKLNANPELYAEIDRVMAKQNKNIIGNSPYAPEVIAVKFLSSFQAALLATIISLYLMAKWFTAYLSAISSSLQKAIREAKIWLLCEVTVFVGDLAKLAFCLIDL